MKHLSPINDLFTLAARPSDEPVPTGASAVQPCGAAPIREISQKVAAAAIAEHHYSHNLPTNVSRNFGAFDGDALLAVACYGSCVARLAPQDWLELRRLVRIPGAVLTLSQFLAGTLRLLKQAGCPAVLSYADQDEGHHGGIYQATNWIYLPQIPDGHHTFVDETGKHIHPRTCFARFGTQSIPAVLAKNPGWTSFKPAVKHRYLMPLNLRKEKALAIIKGVAVPYPKPTKSTEPEPWE